MVPKFKFHTKVRLKIAQIARLRCQGIKDQQIMRGLGLTQSCLSRIVALPEYKLEEEAEFTGVISKLDGILASRTDALRAHFAVAVPAAMRALVDGVLQKRDLKARLEAAKEILDRDPKRIFVKDAIRLSPDSPHVPGELLANLGREADAIVAEVIAGPIGPSGKPN